MQNKNKHLSFQDRVLIEELLNRGNASLTTIAKSFGKDVSTISKEIRKHLKILAPSSSGPNMKRCVKKESCNIKSLGCKTCIHTEGYRCSRCLSCEAVCKDFDPICSKLKKPPYVCNACERTNKCRFERRFYRAKLAQDQYEKTLKESRSVICLNKASTYELDKLVSPALKKGQSIHHIYEANKGLINVCEKTIYNMAHQEVLSVSLDELPRTVQRNIPKVYEYKHPKPKNVLEGRTYIDFLGYHPEISYEVLQLDTVIGNTSGKALLTMEFVESKLLLAFLMDNKTMKDVSSVFYNIRKKLKNIGITQSELMPVILTDNGPEFNDPALIECDSYGEVLSKVFYCNPNAPFQKGHLENNHTNLRRILPKGTSFDYLTQEQINLALSHVNSVIRASCMNKSAYETFCFMHTNGKAILNAFGIKYINPTDVTLKPDLLKRN